MASRGWARFWKMAVVAAIIACATAAARSAELDGVVLPDTQMVAGSRLYLNGIALRTYSWLRIHIYVAGLYLERPSHDPEAILDSPEKKMLVFRFVHDVDEANARKSWDEGFERNCLPPCRLAPGDVARFLAAVPSMRAGDLSTMIFTPAGLTVTMNGRILGTIKDPSFARAVLLTFLGPKPATEQLKRGLLGESG